MNYQTLKMGKTENLEMGRVGEGVRGGRVEARIDEGEYLEPLDLKH